MVIIWRGKPVNYDTHNVTQVFQVGNMIHYAIANYRGTLTTKLKDIQVIVDDETYTAEFRNARQ